MAKANAPQPFFKGSTVPELEEVALTLLARNGERLNAGFISTSAIASI